jgi:hypothetical protein
MYCTETEKLLDILFDMYLECGDMKLFLEFSKMQTNKICYTNKITIVKVMDQLDATKYAVFIASTCFGHQYANRQEYN